MTNGDIINAISKKVCVSKTTAKETLDVILDEIVKSLSQGEEVVFPGFGKFVVNKRKKRKGVNPKTGQAIEIPAMKVPKFKAGKTLKHAVK